MSTLNTWWKKWLTEYLPALMEKHPSSNKTVKVREPHVGELVLMGEDNVPRGQWKLGRVRRLIRSKDNVVRTVELITSSRKVTTRAVNKLFPLEVGGRSDNDVEILDFKIQQTPSEVKQSKNKEEPRKLPPRKSKKQINWKTILCTMIMILFNLVGQTGAQQPMICNRFAPKSLWKFPKLQKCHHAQIHDDLLTEEKIILFKPNHVEYISDGYYCQLRSTHVRRWTDVHGIPITDESDNPPEEMSEQECRRMIRDRECNYGKLSAAAKGWHTNNVLTDEPPNRVSSFFGAAEKNKLNCFLLPVKVFAHHGQETASTAAATIHHCRYQAGKCKPKRKNEYVIWTPNSTQNCDYLETYRGTALVSEKTLILDSWHLMLTFERDKFIQSCNYSLVVSDQGLAFAWDGKKTNSTKVFPTTTTKQPAAQQKHEQFLERQGGYVTTTTTTRKPTTIRKMLTSASTYRPATSRSTTQPTTPVPTTSPRRTTFWTPPPTTTPVQETRLPHYNEFAANCQTIINRYAHIQSRRHFNVTEADLRKCNLNDVQIKELNEPRERPRMMLLSEMWFPHIRSKRDEFEAADLQYLEHDLTKKLKHVATTTCTIINDHSEELERLIRTSPTEAMRKILNRTNILATTLSEDILELQFCHPLQADEYTLLPNPDNCSIPIRVVNDSRPWYIDRSTHQLHRDSRRVVEEECSDKLFLTLEGTLWEFDRHIGTISVAHQTVKSNKEVIESWSFVNHETTIHNVNIRDAMEMSLQETVLDEMESVSEGFKEVVAEEEVHVPPSNWEEDFWAALLDRYALRAWRIWVSIVSGLTTWAILNAIKRHLTGTTGTQVQPQYNPIVPYFQPQFQPQMYQPLVQTPQSTPSQEPPQAQSTPIQSSVVFRKQENRVDLTVPTTTPKKSSWKFWKSTKTETVTPVATPAEAIPLQEMPSTSQAIRDPLARSRRPRSTTLADLLAEDSQ